jgi:iron complex outermembrane receptor protein
MRFRSRVAALPLALLAHLTVVEAQDPKQPTAPPKPTTYENPNEPQQPAVQGEASAVQEIGGRVVVRGEAVVVTANPDRPASESSIATKVEMPLIETPRSISIIDGRTLHDLGATNLTQAHDYAVGMTLLDERGPAFVRGFPVEFYDLRRDGLRTYSWSVRETVALERVQYLRGTSSVLYGDGSPGALVNMVLKKPLPVSRSTFEVSGGSPGFGRLTADLTGPITADRRVRYRVLGAGEWLDNGFSNEERRFTFYPTLAVDVGDRATLTLDAEFYHQRGRNYRHTVPATAATQRGDFSGFPWDLSVSSSDDPYGWTGGNLSPGARLDLKLDDRSSLHVAGRYTKIDGDINGQGLVSLAADGRTANRFQYHEISTWHELQSDTFAATSFRTGTIVHRLVGGVEAGLSKTDSEIGIGAAAPLDIFDPVYPAPAEPVLRPTRFDVLRLGVYATDQIKFGDLVTVVPGLRWSRVETETRGTVPGEAQTSRSVVSPALGLVVRPHRWFSLYATYAQGFEPPVPGQYLEDGRGVEPAEHESLEGGVKADLAGGQISLSAATYRIQRTNVPELDARGFYRQIGEGESRGLEFEATGSFARGLGIRAGYAWTTTKITSDSTGFIGRELPNAPRHKAEFWGRYRVLQGALQGVTAAAGVVYVSDRFTARDNIVVAPSYTRLDASTFYEIGPRLALGLIAHNLTDRRYVTSGTGAIFFAGPPRRIAVQLMTSFQ